LRIVDLDVEAERRLKAPGEELDALFLVEAASTGEERLEAVLVVRDGSGALACGQLVEGVGAQRWPVAEMEKVLEAASRGNALVFLDLDVRHMDALFQVVGSHPHLLFLHDPLLVEVGLTPVDEDQRIGLAIIARKVKLLEPRRPILMVFASPALGG